MKILKGKPSEKARIRLVCLMILMVCFAMMTSYCLAKPVKTEIDISMNGGRPPELESITISVPEYCSEEISTVDSDKSFIVSSENEKLPVAYTGTVYVQQLNVRSTNNSNSDDNIIGIVKYNETVNIIEYDNGWYKIEYKDNYGYVYSKYIEVEDDGDVITEEVKSQNSNKTVTYNQYSTDVIGNESIDRDALYKTIEDIAPELTSICDALISNYENYNIKPSFQLAVFCLESAYGTSYLAEDKNNICGLNAYATSTQTVYEHASSFDTKSDCALEFGSLIYYNYISCGCETVSDISSIYCPPNSYNWTNMVHSIQNTIESTYNDYAA